MKSLTLTLIFVVIATTVGTGLVITRFYAKVNSTGENIDQNLTAYKQLGEAIGLSLAEFPHSEEFIKHWREKSAVDIRLQNRADFLVPDDIEQT